MSIVLKKTCRKVYCSTLTFLEYLLSIFRESLDFLGLRFNENFYNV